jgi:hypothetical protein
MIISVQNALTDIAVINRYGKYNKSTIKINFIDYYTLQNDDNSI